MTRRTADWLAPGAAGPVYGDLEAREGGLVFFPETEGAPAFSVPGPQLMRIGPGPADRARNAAMAGWHLLAVEDGSGAHLLKLPAPECRELLEALVVQRERVGLDAVPIRDGLGATIGTGPEPPAPEEEESDERGLHHGGESRGDGVIATRTAIVEAELLGDGGPVAGRLVVTGGGVAFLPAGPRGGFAISPRGLRSVAPGTSGAGYVTVEGEGVRHVLRLHVEGEAAAFVAELRRERRAVGAADIPLDAPVVPAVDDDGLDAPAPTPAERCDLPPDSLPARWLVLTPGVRTISTRHVDGMSMLLELALLGAVDAPTRDTLAVRWRPTGTAAFAGALTRIEGRAVLSEPQRAASWLGAYVGLLDRDGARAATVRAETREAILDGPGDARAALLVWLVKQYYAHRRVVPPLLFDGAARRGRRCVRRARPSIHIGDDRDATMRAHRVLAATIIQPLGPMF